MIIFGWGHNRVKNIGPVQAHHCTNCNNDVYLQLIKVSTWFTLFFIPVIPYFIKRSLVCPICGFFWEVSKEEFERLKSVKAEGNFEDMVNNNGQIKTETQLNYINEMNDFKKKAITEEVAVTGEATLSPTELLQITTPETKNETIKANIKKTEMDLNMPSLGVRFGAALIDYLLVVIPIYMIMRDSDNTILLGMFMVLVVFVVQATLLGNLGQSIGKKICKIKIVRYPNGEKAGFVKCFLIRTLLNDIFCLSFIYLIVDITFVARSDRRCLHDLLAGTKVVKDL